MAFDRFAAFNWARDVVVRGPAKPVLFALVSRADGDGSCWPSAATLSRDSGFGVSAVKEALVFLERSGLVDVERRTGCPNVYRVRIGVDPTSPPADQVPRRQPATGSREATGLPATHVAASRPGGSRQPARTSPPAGDEVKNRDPEREINPLPPSTPPSRSSELTRDGLFGFSLEAYRVGVELGVRQVGEDPKARIADYPPFAAADVAKALNTHGPRGLDEDRLKWVRETATAFVVAQWEARQFARGWHPAKLVEWLNSGRPKAPPPKPPRQETPADAPWMRRFADDGDGWNERDPKESR